MALPRQPHVVIIGAGFGGLQAAKKLTRAPVTLTVIDKSNHHLFQPLLYQVATAGLSPADIAMPIRSLVGRASNSEVLMAEVTGIDKKKREVILHEQRIPYDYLIVATGAAYHYFGHPEWERIAPGLKTVTDATMIRRKILVAFEKAEIETDPIRRRALLTFVIVGGGPTGVEMAGSIAELARTALARDFRHINPASARIILIEAGPRILATFPEDLAQNAMRSLQRLGVEVRTGSRVQKIDEQGVELPSERIDSPTVIWAAGVIASPAHRWLEAGADRAGRIIVNPDLSLPGNPEIFVIGDTSTAKDESGKQLPGTAPVAMQQGKYVAHLIRARVGGKTASDPFRYTDKGNMATIGRSAAIVDLRGLHLSGYIAWLAWLFVHIFYLIGFRNRVMVMLQWAWSYITFKRGARLITYG